MSQINFLGGTFPVSKNYFKRICLYKSCRKSKCAKKNCWKTPKQITSVVYLYIILFGMHERKRAIEKDFYITVATRPCYSNFEIQAKY